MKLFPHQQEALEASKGFENVAFFHDMGLGKTFTGAEAMFRYDCRCNLLICQKSKIRDWMDHFKTYYPRINLYDLTDRTQLDTFIGQSMLGWHTVLGVINYELCWRREDLLTLEDFCLMLDESSLIQNRKTRQANMVLKMKPSHVILLSGTPVGGKYENLWTQCHLLGWNITEHAYEQTFVNWKLSTPDGSGVRHWMVDRDNPYKQTDRLKRKLKAHGAFFLKTEDVIDLPEQSFIKVMVEPTKEYNTFKKDKIVVITERNTEGFDDVTLVGDTSLTKLLYARQLCGQYNPYKLTAFRDLLQSTDDRLIVFYSFNDELEALKTICQNEGRPTSEVNGSTKDLTAYKNHSNSVTLVQYQAGSKGLNLQKCNRIIYFTLPLSSEHFEQSKKRIHRIGQKRPCQYYLMLCRNTVEEDILKTLEERKDYTDDLFH